MPWQARDGMPVQFDTAGAAAAALIQDSQWNWILPYMPVVGFEVHNTEEFCAAGPPTLDTSALLLLAAAFATRNPQIIAGAIAEAREAVLAVAHSAVFQGYCEMYEPSGEHCIMAFEDVAYAHDSGDAPWSGDSGPIMDRIHPILVGAQSIAVTMTALHTGGTPDMHCYVYNMGTYVDEVGGTPGTLLQSVGHTRTFVLPDSGETHYCLRSNAGGTPRYSVEFCGYPGSYEPYDPEVLPPPDELVPPEPKVYDTIADLGAELDKLELKSDFLLTFVRYLMSAQILPPIAIEAAEVLDPDDELDLTGAIGMLVTLAGIPAEASTGSGDPPRLHRLGRITVGNALGWFPSYELEHSPFVVFPFPVGATRATVTTWPPVVASVRRLYPPTVTTAP